MQMSLGMLKAAPAVPGAGRVASYARPVCQGPSASSRSSWQALCSPDQRTRRIRSSLVYPLAGERFVCLAAAAEASVEDEADDTIELDIKVQGMTGGGCGDRVMDALKGLDHVKGVAVDLDARMATVEVEAPSLMDALNMLPGFVKTVRDLGFEAEPHIEYTS